jgi:DNA-binding transcriptional regulator WhiA
VTSIDKRRSSFSADVRHELALHPSPRACCQLSELQGVLAAARTAEADAGFTCRLTTNIAARKVVGLVHALSGAPGEPGGEGHFRRGRTPVRPSYIVAVPRTPGTPLHGLAIGAAPPARSHCERAHLRGAFVAAGTVSVGGRGSHLEFALTSEAGATGVAVALRRLGVRPRVRHRGRRWLVYIKGGEDVALLLNAMGASQAVLRFENDRILREMRGQANREANSETANLRRSVATAVRQVDTVRRLVAAGVLEAQPQALREMAALRLSMPGASLAQMSVRLGVSKSAVNARLRRLAAVAAEAGLVD